jgi:recombination protein RecA
MYELLTSALQSGLFGTIVVDSITSFAPKARHEGSVVMGLEARVNSDKMRMVMSALEKSNSALIFIQQIRQSIGCFSENTEIYVK